MLLPNPMNTLKTILSGLCLLFSLMLSAQKMIRPTDLPYSNKIEVSNQALESLFHSPEIISLDLRRVSGWKEKFKTNLTMEIL